MRPEYCYLADRNEPFKTFQQIISTLQQIGVDLTNPRSGLITDLIDDGEQRVVTEATINEAVKSRDEVLVQLWLSAGTDLVCDFRQVQHGIVRHAYSLDGLDRHERQRIVRWAIDYFSKAATEGIAFLMIVDLDGRTSNVDWDGVVAQRIAFPNIWPAALGLPASWAHDLWIPAIYSRERIGDCDLLISPYESM